MEPGAAQGWDWFGYGCSGLELLGPVANAGVCVLSYERTLDTSGYSRRYEAEGETKSKEC
jgi:hypothetical protein